jgi:hypothetical protein
MPFMIFRIFLYFYVQPQRIIARLLVMLENCRDYISYIFNSKTVIFFYFRTVQDGPYWPVGGQGPKGERG